MSLKNTAVKTPIVFAGLGDDGDLVDPYNNVFFDQDDKLIFGTRSDEPTGSQLQVYFDSAAAVMRIDSTIVGAGTARDIVVRTGSPLTEHLRIASGGDVTVSQTSTSAFKVTRTAGTGMVFGVNTTVPRPFYSTFDPTFTGTSGNMHWEAQGGDFLLYIDVYSNTADDEAEIVGRRARGTKAAPLAVLANDELYDYEAHGWDGVVFGQGNGDVSIVFIANENYAVGAHGTRMEFWTNPDGAVSRTRRWTIENNGDLTMEGDWDIEPLTDGQGEIGTTTNRFGFVRSNVLHIIGSTTAIFLESANGVTAPVSGAATGRIRYNNVTATFQISVQGGAYLDIATGTGIFSLQDAYDNGSLITTTAAETAIEFVRGATAAAADQLLLLTDANASALRTAILAQIDDANSGVGATFRLSRTTSTGILQRSQVLAAGDTVFESGLTAPTTTHVLFGDGDVVFGASAMLSTERARVTGGDLLVDFTSTTAFIINETGSTTARIFIFDTTNKRMGFAASGASFLPSFDFHFQKETVQPDFVYDFYGAGGSNFTIFGRKAGGTIAAPTALADDDDMWEFACQGWDGAAFADASSILMEAAGAWTSAPGNHGGRIVFKTRSSAAGAALLDRMVLTDFGTLVIGIAVAPFGTELLRVQGAARVEGKLTVTGVIDPTAVILSDPAAGTDLYFESSNGTTAGLSGAATGRIRYDNVTGLWQTSVQAGAYQNIATVASGGGTLAFVQNGNSFGANAVIGTNDAFDLLLERAGVSTFTLTTSALNPSVDVTSSIGTSSLRLVNVVANNFRIFAALGDANPTGQFMDAAVQFGAGGGSALDSRFRRAGTSLMVMDNNGTSRTWIVDAANRRVGLTTVDDTFTPSFTSHYEHQTTDLFIVYDNYGNNLNLIGRRSGGTKAAPTDVGSGIDLFLWGARGWEGGTFSGDQATLELETSQAWSAGAHGARFSVKVTANGSTALTERFRVENDGSVQANVSIGIMNAIGDANFNNVLTSQSLAMGAGGGAALDARMRRTAVSTFTFDNNGAGGATLVPPSDNVAGSVIGTDALRWNRIRAVTIVSGDLELLDEERNAHWVIREEPDCVMFENKKTGKKYKAVLEEVA
jgi:hypothetical protein